MSDVFVNTLILISALGSGLVAGTFFAFSTFVMTALGRLAPAQGISAMQAINVTVINPWFFGAFFGTALGCITLAIVAYSSWGASGTLYLAAGAVLYLCGCILVTMLFNVPLNNALAAVKSDSTDGATLWAEYLSTWTVWNHIRTGASLAAMACFIMAFRQ